jgi:CBS domain-containing protein
MLIVANVMTTEVFSVTPETPIRDVAKFMRTKRISGVPVIDREKRVLGIVGEDDLIRHAKVVGEQRQPWWLTAFTNTRVLAQDYVRTHGRTAAEVMAARVITVAPTASVAECANILDRCHVKRVLVVDKGNLVGIVTRSDLLQAITTADVTRPAAVDDRAIRAWFFVELEKWRWAHLLSKNIVVRNGVIYISGFVETEDERHALRLAAENVPGVKRVEDHAKTRPLFRLG